MLVCPCSDCGSCVGASAACAHLHGGDSKQEVFPDVSFIPSAAQAVPVMSPVMRNINHQADLRILCDLVGLMHCS